nr:hypothetical protein [Roseateles sp. XES5]
MKGSTPRPPLTSQAPSWKAPGNFRLGDVCGLRVPVCIFIQNSHSRDVSAEQYNRVVHIRNAQARLIGPSVVGEIDGRIRIPGEAVKQCRQINFIVVVRVTVLHQLVVRNKVYSTQTCESRRIDDKGILASLTGQLVVTFSTFQPVISGAAIQEIISGSADQNVVMLAAPEVVVA